MRKTNSTKNKISKKNRITKTIATVTALALVMAMAGCGSISDSETTTESITENTAESNSATETDTTAESNSATEESESETVCWIMETEKEKALALQEYTSNALLELASAENEETEIDGGVDTEEEATTESSKSSSSGSSSSSTSSSSKSSSSSSGSSGSSSSSSGSSNSSNKSSSHKHSYTSKVTKQATCTSTGTITYTCSCGDSYTEEIAKTDHTWVDCSITVSVRHPAVWEDYEHICRDCNYRTNSGEEMSAHLTETHHFGEYNGTVLISESYWTTGTGTVKRCSICGEEADTWTYNGEKHINNHNGKYEASSED